MFVQVIHIDSILGHKIIVTDMGAYNIGFFSFPCHGPTMDIQGDTRLHIDESGVVAAVCARFCNLGIIGIAVGDMID